MQKGVLGRYMICALACTNTSAVNGIHLVVELMQSGTTWRNTQVHRSRAVTNSSIATYTDNARQGT